MCNRDRPHVGVAFLSPVKFVADSTELRGEVVRGSLCGTHGGEFWRR